MNDQRILRCAPDMSVTKVGRDYLLELQVGRARTVLDRPSLPAAGSPRRRAMPLFLKPSSDARPDRLSAFGTFQSRDLRLGQMESNVPHKIRFSRMSRPMGAYSGANRSPVPTEFDHRFRREPITSSGASRSLLLIGWNR